MHLATKIDKTLVLLTHGIERPNFHTFLFYFASVFSIRTASSLGFSNPEKKDKGQIISKANFDVFI